MRPPGENRRRPETLVNSARALGSKTRTCGIFGRVIFGTSGIFGTVRLLGRIMGARREFAFLRAQMTSGYRRKADYMPRGENF